MLEKYLRKEWLHPGKNIKDKFSAAKPFPHLVLKDFFTESFAKEIEKAVQDITLVRQESDLFSFAQSEDLRLLKNQVLKELHSLLNSREMKEWMLNATGIKADDEIDGSVFLYEPADYLLPHDDTLEKRRIAYTYHLSTLSTSKGGALEFFKGNDKAISIPPKFNTLIVFGVKEKITVHQVSEVMDAERWSVSGWFNDQ